MDTYLHYETLLQNAFNRRLGFYSVPHPASTLGPPRYWELYYPCMIVSPGIGWGPELSGSSDLEPKLQVGDSCRPQEVQLPYL